MPQETNSTVLVLSKALVLAQRSGASEIRIEHLLAAMDWDEPAATPVQGRFIPVPACEMALAADATAALKPLGDIWSVSLKVLRSTLVEANSQLRG